MGRFGAAFLLVLASATWASADEKDPIAHARSLYNERHFDEAIAAADQARLLPARADSADLIAARAYLERFRGSDDPADLTNAIERLRRLDPHRLGPREGVEFLVGLGEALFLEKHYGAAAEVFNSILASVLAPDSDLPLDARERVLDWWASALDHDAQPRPEIERQGVYQRIRDRMHEEIAEHPDSAAAAYWLSAAARGQGDLQSAWDSAEAGWVRAGLASDRGVSLRADLDRLMLRAIVPERARVLAVPADTLTEKWAEFKERWTK
jgi:hypothetical protein